MASFLDRHSITGKPWFVAGLVLYSFLSALVAVWAYQTFGIADAIGLLLILSLPAAVSLRILARWSTQRSRDFALLAGLCVIAYGGIAFLVPIWFDSGLDKRHQHDSHNRDFIEMLANDPAFAQVEARRGKKGIVFLSGHVQSDADLKQLKNLVEKQQISAMFSITSEHKPDVP